MKTAEISILVEINGEMYTACVEMQLPPRSAMAAAEHIARQVREDYRMFFPSSATVRTSVTLVEQERSLIGHTDVK